MTRLPLFGMTKLLAPMLLAVALSMPATATDFETGQRALKQGRFDDAYDIWLPLANAGDTASQYSLGFLFKNGQGVDRDDAKAASWFEQAASKGHVGAQTMMGLLYYSGIGVPQSFEKSAGFYTRSADAGDAEVLALTAEMLYG